MLGSRVCFLGSARYTRPLDPTNEKKFRALKAVADLFVIGFAPEARFRRFREHGRFYLFPQLPLPLLRYIEMFLFGHMSVVFLIVRHRVRVVIAQSPYEGVAAALAVRFAGWLGYPVKLVVESHGDFENSLFLQRKIPCPDLYRWLMNRMARYSITRADLLRAISRATKEQLQDLAPEKTILQFPAWTDIETFIQARRSKNETAPVLYAGVLTPLKGVHHLVNAFALLAPEFPGARLSIVGKDENRSYAAALREQVKTLGLSEQVHFSGVMPQSELARWMSQACVLVLPSKSEGLGRVIMEAMATGTPVIASRVGGIPDLVENGVTGFLVPPGDENAIAERLRWILTHRDEAETMGERARVYAKECMSTEAYVRNYKQIFELGSQRAASDRPLGDLS